jgi:hypothetical protein
MSSRPPPCYHRPCRENRGHKRAPKATPRDTRVHAGAPAGPFVWRESQGGTTHYERPIQDRVVARMQIHEMADGSTRMHKACPCGRLSVDVTDRPNRAVVRVRCTLRCMWTLRESNAHARLTARRTAKYELNAANFSEAKKQQLLTRTYFGSGKSDSSGTGSDCGSDSSGGDTDGEDSYGTSA